MSGDRATEPPVLNFTAAGDGVVLDLPALVSSRMLIQASSGGGKSYALRGLLEGTHGRIPQIILDPEGEYASLRERFDYLLAGAGWDVPATPDVAAVLCRRLMELRVSAVIDLYELPMQERRRFIRIFLETLVHLDKSLWHPTLVVLDEAQDYAPESGFGEAESTAAVESLVRLGRKRGLAAVLATARLAMLSKNAAGMLANKLIGRCDLDLDIRRAARDLGFTAKEGLQLRHVQPGEFFAYGPAITREVTLVRTPPVRTSHPRAGEVTAYSAPPASAAIREILAQLADLPEQAQQEAHTVEELRGQVTELRRKLRERPAAASEIRVVEKRVEMPVIPQDLKDELAAVMDLLSSQRKTLAEQEVRLRGFLLREAPSAPEPAPPPARAEEPPAAETSAIAYTADTPPPPRPANGVLRPYALAVLRTLGEHEVPLTEWQLRWLVPDGVDMGRHKREILALQSLGYVTADGAGRLSLTAEGYTQIGGAPTLSKRPVEETGAQLRQGVRKQLKHASLVTFDALTNAYPRALARKQLAAVTNYAEESRAWRDARAGLIKPGLVLDLGRSKGWRANPELFPERARGAR